MVSFLSMAAAEIAARRPARPDPMMRTSCVIVVVLANYADPSFLQIRREANSHIYFELPATVQAKKEAINYCKDRAIIININYDARTVLAPHEPQEKR